ncbi:MAG: hypothetical protein HeimC2_02960 [Candidatus Heimdallarchaeota archaeon LC_2]|nr:MAG: hypothetical protein HeimC2_02960 [Candidatus Heimdallarchaeota archaeon LC_2]
MLIKLNRYLIILILIFNILQVNVTYSQSTIPLDPASTIPNEESSSSGINSPLQLNQIKQNEECFVPCDEILRIQVKDAVTTLDDPKFVALDNINAPNSRDKVLGVVVNGVSRAYPYDILRWHEIVNDIIDGVHVSITYTDLTASGIAYLTSDLDNSELGYSGQVYENNLVFYDRISDSLFSQMGGIGLKGEKIEVSLQTTYAIETTMGTWQKLYPNTLVLSRDTGSNIDYETFPYGYFSVGDTIFYQSRFNNDEFPYSLYKEKALTHVIKINNEVRLLPFSEIAILNYINHNLNGKDVFTIFSLSDFSAITYSRELDSGLSLEFSFYNDTGNLFDITQTLGQPLFIDNDQKSIWNYKGIAISGPLVGQKLNLIPSYNAYWYAASAYFPDADIYTVKGIIPSNNTKLSTSGSSSNTQQIFYVSIFALISIIVLSLFAYPRIKTKFF